MLEPASPLKTGTPPAPPKTPEKLGPLGEKLLKGKSLQKSPSLKGQLNFDQFLGRPKALPPAGPKEPDGPPGALNNINKLNHNLISAKPSVEPRQVEEAIGVVERGNRLLTQSSYINSLRAPLGSPQLQAFAEQRHRALTLLGKVGTGPNLEPVLGEEARQLALDCLKNLTDPQYYEPPENIAPILGFYIQTYPQVSYQDMMDTMEYLETCYEDGLERYPNYRELKRALAAKLSPSCQDQTRDQTTSDMV